MPSDRDRHTAQTVTMKLYIKYMVSIRCKMAVKSELDKLGLSYSGVELGEVDVNGDMTSPQTEQFRHALLRSGLELMDDKKAILIEKIKSVIIERVHYAEDLPRTNFSDYISDKLKQPYTHLATLFSEVTGTTIEHYIILHKIEKVKELLLYDELTLTEISHKLHYSSVAHLSTQFKKITGLTPTFFKNMKQHRTRNALEDLIIIS
jgi:AraC-like DNA-binding protein